MKKYAKYVAKLKKLGALEKFEHNLKHHRGHGNGVSLEEYRSQKYSSFSDFISSAFFWGDAPEGAEYWADVCVS